MRARARAHPSAVRHAAALFAVCGLLAYVAAPLPGARVLPLLAVGTADLAVAVLAVLLPWHRWAPSASLVLAVPAFAIVGASYAAELVPPRALTALFVLVFVYVGSHHQRWHSLRVAPVAAGTYALAVLHDDHGVPLDPAAVVLMVFAGVLVAETVARSQERLRASEADMRFLVEHTTDLVSRLGADGVVRYTAPSIERVLGWRPDEVIGRNKDELRHPDDVDPVALALSSPGGPVTVERRLRKSDGSYAWLESVAQAVTGPDGRREVLVTARDITRRREIEAELEHIATHDGLTGLPNRSLLDASLGAALESGGSVAVAFLDLDGFKAVNDLHGHQVGDRLLVQVGHRLLTVTREADLVARYGGDEFVLVVDGVESPVELLALAARVEAELSRPYRMGTLTLTIGASVGIVAARPGDSSQYLIDQADRSMYAMKSRRQVAAVTPRPRTPVALPR